MILPILAIRAGKLAIPSRIPVGRLAYWNTAIEVQLEFSACDLGRSLSVTCSVTYQSLFSHRVCPQCITLCATLITRRHSVVVCAEWPNYHNQ